MSRFIQHVFPVLGAAFLYLGGWAPLGVVTGVFMAALGAVLLYVGISEMRVTLCGERDVALKTNIILATAATAVRRKTSQERT